MGVDRATLTVLVDGYAEEEVAGEKRVVLRIRRRWRRSRSRSCRSSATGPSWWRLPAA